MARQRYSPPPPEPAAPKGTSLFRILFFGIIIFLLLTVGLQTCGVNVVSRSDREKLIDKPHSDDRQERDVPEDLDVEEN